ncbi:MAG TPA: DNA repair exonuclease [Chthonomonadales bacterium]|nr:DNA repair exonuclease [Chthonomonadales bacterium]
MLRFLHAADLHLGAAFQGVRAGNPAVAERLRRATYDALDRIVEIAEEERAQFVVVAGDLFNAAEANLRAQFHLQKAAVRLHEHGIATFAVRGNHDPLGGNEPPLNWPPSFHLFPAEPSTPLDAPGGAVVYGQSYGQRTRSENLAQGYPEPGRAGFAVALLHTSCAGSADHDVYAPCSLNDLSARNYDYWALGHVHQHAALRPGGPAVVYPGCPQGLNPKETGPRGCCVVTVDDSGVPSIEFRATDAVRWHALVLDIGAMDSADALRDALDERLAETERSLLPGGSAVVRARLVGRGPLHRLLRDESALAAVLGSLRDAAGDDPAVWLEDLRVETRPAIDLDHRASTQDFVGDFLRLAGGAANDSEALEALRKELAPLWGPSGPARKAMAGASGPGAGAGRALPSDDELRAWIERARVRGADLLVGEEA